MSSYHVIPVGAAPCAILKVSLPDGVYHGVDVDPWLNESYVLSLTGAVQTFVVRINNTSASLRSYDTRLVIALNDAGYNNLLSLVVNGTSVPKSAFKCGTPKPYNKWTWPSGDVYPTWFNDTCVNVGTIGKKSYVDLVVSVNFSDPSGARMHFDAYGKTVTYSPPSDGYITHNPLSEDSTVLFQAGPPPQQPPFASFTFTPTYPEANQVVTFDASGSYDPDGQIVSYAWDFGDGTPIVVENDPTTYHTYTSFGDYIVRLTVTDDDGLTDEETAVVHVSQHPIAAFTFSPPDPLVHEVVTFDASASSPDGGVIVSYTWDFGDGNITTVSEPIITHAYEAWGKYTVTLNVTDSEGKWDTETKEITVENAPVADFTWDPYLPQRGETVTFNASISSPDGGVIISYAWDFGDGTPMIEENDPIVTHVYAIAGDYLVTLNVTDSEGRWDTETKTIRVAPVAYYLEVKTDPEGITTIPGENWYDEGAEVTLTAPEIVPISDGARYRFSYWDVDGIPQGIGVNQITVLMNANHVATAHYITEYYLTVSSPFGIVGGEGWYQTGATAYATLSTGIVDHGNGTRRVFINWGGDASGTNYAQSNPIVMDGPKTAIANWKTQYYLELQANPPGVTAPSGTGWYDAETYAPISTLEYVPGGSRYRFVSWTTANMAEITDPYSPSTTVLVDEPKTVTANYVHQYQVTFAQTGLDGDASGTVVTVNDTALTYSNLPYSIWVDENSIILYSYGGTISSTVSGKKFVLTGITGPSSPITVTADTTVTGNYKTQYYLEVSSAYGSPSPTSGWYDAGSGITATVNSPVSGPTGTRYVCTGWSGAGSVPPSGMGTSVTFTLNAPSSITWNWKTQYLLTVVTDPPGLTPQPARNPTGEAGPANSWWYDAGTSVMLTAQTVTGYTFSYWDVDGASQGSGVNPITVVVNAPKTATAHYTVQVITYTLKIETTTGGTTNPTPGTYTYAAGSQVQVTAIPSSGYVFDHWELNGTNVGTATTYTVTMNNNYILKAIFRQIPPLTVSISPMSASMLVGQQVTFTSNVTGGTAPYTYQWYLNDAAVPSANGTSWTFKPTAAGIYYVYLKVVDAGGNIAQSGVARIEAASVPVGGYSVSLAKTPQIKPLAAYVSVLYLFGAILSLTKRKRK
ncbi:MAG: PKD domain-containing protein [Candidatus Bathyarchaeia archaeon]